MDLAFGYLQYGFNYTGMQVFPVLLGIEFAKALPFVDGGKIAVSGHSLGALPLAMLGLISDDVQAVLYNDSVCDQISRFVAITELDKDALTQFAVPWHILPQLWKWFPEQDLLAALVPKYLACNEGGAGVHLDTVRRAYAFVGADMHLRITQYPKYDGMTKEQLHESLPDHGLSFEEYYDLCHVDVPDHSFRAEPSLALLRECFGLKTE